MTKDKHNIHDPKIACKILRDSKHTLVTEARYESLFRNMRDCSTREAIVECGVYKGGTFSYMCSLGRKFGYKTAWGFDTFAGIPYPTKKDPDVFGKRGGPKDLAATEEDVKKALKLMKIDDLENIKLIKGLFDDTLPESKEEIGSISILRLDSDWYESTMTALTELYPLVVSGGSVLIDDYNHFRGCKAAVNQFRKDNDINSKLIKSDGSEVVWIK